MKFVIRNVIMCSVILSVAFATWSGEDSNVSNITGRPVYSVSVTVDADDVELFVTDMIEMFKSNAFAVRVVPNPRAGHFQIQMFRDDLKVFASNPFEVTKFRMHFYRQYEADLVDESITLLVDEMQAVISNMDNSNIQEFIP